MIKREIDLLIFGIYTRKFLLHVKNYANLEGHAA